MADAEPLVTKHQDGTAHVTVDGNLHSVDDEPGAILSDGTKFWYRDGKLHRVIGPAVICSNGIEEWWQDGERHRAADAAVIYPDDERVELPEMRGLKQWWIRGKLAREEHPPRTAAYMRELEALRKKHFGG